MLADCHHSFRGGSALRPAAWRSLECPLERLPHPPPLLHRLHPLLYQMEVAYLAHPPVSCPRPLGLLHPDQPPHVDLPLEIPCAVPPDRKRFHCFQGLTLLVILTAQLWLTSAFRERSLPALAEPVHTVGKRRELLESVQSEGHLYVESEYVARLVPPRPLSVPSPPSQPVAVRRMSTLLHSAVGASPRRRETCLLYSPSDLRCLEETSH